ncbi:amidohydrolase family protein [Mucilaginibacter arboris]|uniref:Amidohydrolase family protein n=1 Tax=Mucilaginibacter arboris TaxID=2682090 RepID=A0A7K1SRN6_9SPHI|nr:amidohydrolase family protein [Mucilaginibacter arboris]MVN19975.1 amidohydrolase family protein [Mucilaginibacter arboris]
MKKFTADYILTSTSSPIKNGSIVVDDNGKVLQVEDPQNLTAKPQQQYADLKAEKLSGVICPGFVNTHCHLELSHLKGKVPAGEGLIEFIKNVQKLRKTDDAEVIEAAAKADEQMEQNGIVAVGDIANSAVTASVKLKSKLYYHNFIEVYGFDPKNAEAVFNSALAIQEQFKPLAASITPHAAYSVSKELFRLIRKESDDKNSMLTIHNQESDEENKLYRYKQGSFLDFYDRLGLDISFFKPQARNSIQSIIPLFSNRQNVLMVHNTFTSMKDVYFTRRFDRKINWCFCPGANLYIEKTLPKLNIFTHHGFNITLGTDSLASNHVLCILKEMRLLQENFPYLELENMVEWATINGAKFLGIDHEKGTIEAGKTPGLNLISGLDRMKITPETKVRKLA